MENGLCKRVTCTDCPCLPRLTSNETLSPDHVKTTPYWTVSRDATAEALSEVKEMLQDAVQEIICLKKKLEHERMQNEVSEDRCRLLDMKRRHYKAECRRLEHDLEELKFEQQTEAGAWQKHWEEVHNECEMLRTEIYALQTGTSMILHPLKESLSAQSYVASPEGPSRLLTVYSGAYSFSVNTFRVMANSIKFRLAGVSRSLARAVGHPVDIALDAVGLSDGKYAMHTRVSEILFKGFEDESFTIPECLVPEVNRDNRRDIYLNQVRELGTLQDEEQVMTNFHYLVQQCFHTVSKTEPTRLIPELCPTSCTKVGLCGCGRATFMCFCRRQLHRLAKFLKPQHAFWSHAAEEGYNILPNSPFFWFMKRLLSLLAYLWRAHLVFLTFEEPCRMFKVKRGCIFDPDYMAFAYEDPEVTSQGVVESTIIPGFYIGEVVVRSQVYVRHAVIREADTVSKEFLSTNQD